MLCLRYERTLYHISSSKHTAGVVVFPTAHKCGALTLSHDGGSWTFDSSTEFAGQATFPEPAVAYVAFYSDVTHSMQPVLVGHRVTLTYNLFLTDRPGRSAAAIHRIVPAPNHPKATWAKGVCKLDPRTSTLGPVLQMLKGSDARIRTVSERVGPTTQVKILYNSGENYCGAGHDVLADDVLEEIMHLNRVGSQYIAYGNETSLGHIYGISVPAIGVGVHNVAVAA
ncbi:hypothetical protein C8R44DRAFT_885245 [Mycena epipterygia]|nr:hypothetical protein C8R44DRAFT_885245 [Mycena epipterygia]